MKEVPKPPQQRGVARVPESIEATSRIKAELPEVKKEDVRVNVEDGVLTISGERKAEREG